MARSGGSAATSSRRCFPGTVDIGLLESARPDPDRAGFAALHDRGPPGDDRRVGRHRHRRPGPRLRRQPDPQRRPRALRRQGRRPRQALLLRAGDAQRGVRPPGARERPAPGDRPRRAVGRLPADRPRRRRGDLRASRRWCAGTIPTRGPISPGQVHPARRGMRPDRQDRRMGASRPRSPKRRTGPTRSGSRSTCRRSSSTIPAIVDIVADRARARPEFAPSGSSWRSPRACSLPTATRPTRPSPG